MKASCDQRRGFEEVNEPSLFSITSIRSVRLITLIELAPLTGLPLMLQHGVDRHFARQSRLYRQP